MSLTADINQMKTDVPLKGYFCDTKAERGGKKDLHSNDSIIALKPLTTTKSGIQTTP